MVFALVVAHEIDSPLPSLLDEFTDIRKRLRPLQDRSLLQIEDLPNAKREDIQDLFSKHAGNISFFHYAGHANGKSLSIPGGGNAKGLAALFGLENQQRKVNPPILVFLNGCSSRGQVDDLLAIGVKAVIATNCEIKDESARIFAAAFYQHFCEEGRSLGQAFDFAKGILAKSDAGKSITLVDMRGSGRAPSQNPSELTWGLYLNEGIAGKEREELEQIVLNALPRLSPYILQNTKVRARESLLALVDEFLEQAGDLQNDQDPLLELITRLPWTIGTHLRRLFVLDQESGMAETGLPRLKEINQAYQELLRFIAYVLYSSLWDERQKGALNDHTYKDQALALDLQNGIKVDYLYQIRQCLKLLQEIPGDEINLEANVADFLQVVDEKLLEGHAFMQALDACLVKNDPKILEELIALRKSTLDQTCLHAEGIYTAYLRAALFLTQYRLFSIRSISVDKVRYIDAAEPFVHQSLSLHAAFGALEPLLTMSKEASDNYCIMLAPRDQKDPLAKALNLSPFYLDKSSWLSGKANAYPAIHMLYAMEGFGRFHYRYIDQDVNHQYLYNDNQDFEVHEFGAKFPDLSNAISVQEARKFKRIYQQFQRFNQDFQAP